MNVWLFLVGASLCNIIANLLMKKSSFAVPESSSPFFQPWFVIGLAFFGANLLLYTKALERLPISVGYPILVGSSIVGISLVSMFWFAESLSGLNYLGIGFIFGGVYLLAS